MKESDLYLPLKRFLESQNYEVKGEIHDCDVVAVRDDEAPVVVELKLSLNLDVVLQAVERLSLTSKVYIGIPENINVLKRRRRNIIKLTAKGRRLMTEVEPLYGKEVERIMAALKEGEQKRLVAMLEKVRNNIAEYEVVGSASER